MIHYHTGIARRIEAGPEVGEHRGVDEMGVPGCVDQVDLASAADLVEIVAGEMPPEWTLVVAHDVHPAARRRPVDGARDAVERVPDARRGGQIQRPGSEAGPRQVVVCVDETRQHRAPAQVNPATGGRAREFGVQRYDPPVQHANRVGPGVRAINCVYPRVLDDQIELHPATFTIFGVCGKL